MSFAPPLFKVMSLTCFHRASKKGLWGLKNFEHPAEYKRRSKMSEEGMAAAEETVKREKRPASGGYVRNFFRGILKGFSR